MNTRRTSSRGAMLAELIVALGLTSLLLVFVISGVLFVQRYVDQWKHRDTVGEDLAFVAGALTTHIRECRSLNDHGDSLVFVEHDGCRIMFHRSSNGLTRDGQPMIRAELHLDTLAIIPAALRKSPTDTILPSGSSGVETGLYRLLIAVSGPHAADTFATIVRNDYAYHKYTP